MKFAAVSFLHVVRNIKVFSERRPFHKFAEGLVHNILCEVQRFYKRNNDVHFFLIARDTVTTLDQTHQIL